MSRKTVAVIGLGYVGLPLALEFSKYRSVIGFDLNPERIAALGRGIDTTLEVTGEDLSAATNLSFTCDTSALGAAEIYVVTVPTPVDSAKRPDLDALISASTMIGSHLKRGDIVIYESTVYPGCTEEICVPALERASSLQFNVDFFVGYSPERINPGDKSHRLPSIVKVTSGSTPEIAIEINALYSEIIAVGTHLASSIMVAEAAKVIENTQRDLNIALMNELSLIFTELGIDTCEVLAAAGTKWNFLPFRPGLVGGHCIGVDPYYLTHKAQQIGYYPEVILSGRRINDRMGKFVADRTIKLMLAKGIELLGARVLILGITFKENCPDVRNTRVVDIVSALREYGIQVDIYDPLADGGDVRKEYGLSCLTSPPAKRAYDGVIVAVAHDQFLADGPESLRDYCRGRSVLFDVKAVFPIEASDGRL